MRSTLTRIAACTLLLCSAGFAQTAERPFPLDVTGTDASLDALVLTPRPQATLELANHWSVRMIDVLLPDGRLVDLELERISVARRRFALSVDGVPRDDLIAQPGLSLWQGAVAGVPGSSVMLSFSAYGSRGWIQSGGALVHLMPRPDASGRWDRSDALLVTESALNDRGHERSADCRALAANGGAFEPAETLPAPVSSGGGWEGGGGCVLREGKIAVETDYQLFQVFGDLNAMTAYVTTLLSFVSARYEEQISTVLTYPYLQFYTTPDDPWQAQDNGGNCIDVLNEFRAAWEGNVPGGGRIGHMLSGANLGCGVAWLDVLCSNSLNFSVSGNLNGNVNFPVVQQPNNWDFIVIAHELGHNFGTPHTHDFCPPLDECADTQYFGPCQTQRTCSNSGTIMSYCHTCPGGTANINPVFHPQTAALMIVGANDCLPLYPGAVVDSPELLAPGVPTPVTLTANGAVQSAVELLYSYDGGAFQTIVMTDAGGGMYTAELPAATCTDTPRYYYRYDDACGPLTLPAGAPTNAFSAFVGFGTVTLADDFESDQGWIAENLGATTGDWERGVPVDDAGWPHDPATDSDGSGSAYLTMNQVGNTDVDNGAVRLSSPVLDLSGGAASVSYDYFLTLTNEDGADALVIEASANGAAGPWFEVARHDTDGALAWRSHTISTDDFATAGVVPSASTQLRFTVNDGGNQSIVEAGLDAFLAQTVDCTGRLGSSYCTPATDNSTGAPGEIRATGSPIAAVNDLTLTATSLPDGQFAYFLASMTQGSIPNPGAHDGTLCVIGNVGRFYMQVGQISGNQISITVDTQNVPVNPPAPILSGETWNFQCWFRDMNPTQTSNFTDGVSVLFPVSPTVLVSRAAADCGSLF